MRLFRRYVLAGLTVTLAACGDDRGVNPSADGHADTGEELSGTLATAGTITSRYDLRVGQSVRITPRSTTRTNRLRWTTANPTVASVTAQGVVTGMAPGSATVTVSGSGVLESHAVAVTAPVATLTGFSLQPQAGVTLNVGQTQQFTTTQTWSDGGTRTSGVTYAATGGTITSTGLFTAGSVAGTFLVIATCSCTSPAVADTTAVSVQAPAQLTKLTISPDSVALSAGGSRQFMVTANWSTGATTVPPVTWSATGGTVSSSGNYVAPSTAGTYRVIVAHTNGTLRDTAIVTVSGGTTTTPTPPPAPGLFFSDDFDNGQRNSANGFTWGGSATQPNPRISNERSFSGTHSMRFEYAGTPFGGQGWSEERFNMGRYLSELAFEYMIFVPANFKHRDVPANGAGANNKFFSLWRDNYADNTGSWQISVGWNRTSSAESYALFHTTRSSHNWIAPFADKPQFIGANTLMKPGQWNRIRFYVKAATYRGAPSLTADGIMRLWINDTLFFSTTTADFNNFDPNFVGTTLRNGYLLGYANSGFDETTVFFIDAVKFYTGNPGW